MKEITNSEVNQRTTFVFAFDIPETYKTKGKDNIKVTICLPDYVAFGKKLDTEYLELVAKLLAEADWYDIAIDEYFGEDFEGNTVGMYVQIPLQILVKNDVNRMQSLPHVFLLLPRNSQLSVIILLLPDALCKCSCD